LEFLLVISNRTEFKFLQIGEMDLLKEETLKYFMLKPKNCTNHIILLLVFLQNNLANLLKINRSLVKMN
jgi:hypothetical protein